MCPRDGFILVLLLVLVLLVAHIFACERADTGVIGGGACERADTGVIGGGAEDAEGLVGAAGVVGGAEDAEGAAMNILAYVVPSSGF